MSYIFTIFFLFPKRFSLPSQLFNGFCSKNDANQKAWTARTCTRAKEGHRFTYMTKLQYTQHVPKRFETGH